MASAAPAPVAPARPPADPPHPAVWRASQLGASRSEVTASGFAALDAELPGGGWPHRALTELLLPHPGVGELRLLGPALATAAAQAGCALLAGAPGGLSGWALQGLGVAPQRWVVIDRGAGPDRPAAAELLWVLEQALRSGHLGPVLAWLPGPVRADALRRLQLAAQAHDAPVFLLRGLAARERPSAAPLRLLLQPAGIDRLALHLFKRRGPLLAQPLHLALPPVLAERDRRRAQARRQPPRPLQPVVDPAAHSAGRATVPQAGAGPALLAAG